MLAMMNIGHRATHRSTPHPQGFTHDWSAYVEGVGDVELHHFVEKVVFELHETFQRPIQGS